MESRLSLRERVFALAMGAFAACAAQKASVAGSDDSLAKEVVAAPDRTERDRSRDPHRKPAEMLAFFGVRPGMRVAWVPLLEDAVPLVAGWARAGDTVLTLGAGDVDRAAPLILEALA